MNAVWNRINRRRSRPALYLLRALPAMVLVWSCFIPIDIPVRARGVVRPHADPIRIMSDMGGRIRDVYIREGSEVQAGSVLIQLDPGDMLRKKGFLESRIHSTELRSTGPRAHLAALYHDLEQTRIDLDRLTITSPANGRIAFLVSLHAGEIISAGADIAILVPRSGNLVIECRLPSSARAYASPGHRVRLHAAPVPARQYAAMEGAVLSITPDARILISPARYSPELHIGATFNVIFGARRQHLPGLLFDVLAEYLPAL